MADLISTGLHWGIGALLAGFLVSFLIWYVAPGWRLRIELKQALKALNEMKAKGPVLDRDRVAREAMPGPTLPHCWGEYQDTLHQQYGLNAMGERVVTRLRATAMASSFFNEGTLIEVRMGTEFFKHLPGILTGLGIIGTFSGLILGLQGFQVSDDAAVVKQSLQGLLHAVGSAFLVSACAIVLAMVVTFFEKVMVNRRLAQVERLVNLIDSLFDSGAGEEYLQKLVESSESSATQAQQIKDALVSDLRSILTELTQAQINASAAGHEQTSKAIAQSIQEGLHEPLTRISEAVQNVSHQQGDAVNRLLTDVLASFAQQMREIFGGQLSGMNEVLAETARSIQAASSRFDTLAAQLQSAGNDAADAMAKRMEALMESMSARQAEADARMNEFLQTIRQSVQDGQAQSAEMMMGTFAELSQTTKDLVAELRQQAQGQAQDHAQRVSRISTETTDSLGKQAASVQALVEAVDRATDAMRAAAEKAVSGVNASVERMAIGADRLHGASGTLEGALNHMGGAANAVSSSIHELHGASTELTAATRATNQALADQQQVRSAIAAMVEQLSSIVDSAKRDASVHSQLVSSIERASETLKQASGQADDYLSKVNEALAGAHESFATQLTSTLRHANTTFHEELGKAVDMLRGAIQDLGDTLDSVPAVR